MREIFVLKFKAQGLHCVWSIRLEHQKKYFLVWTSLLVNDSISLTDCAVSAEKYLDFTYVKFY